MMHTPSLIMLPIVDGRTSIFIQCVVDDVALNSQISAWSDIKHHVYINVATGITVKKYFVKYFSTISLAISTYSEYIFSL